MNKKSILKRFIIFDIVAAILIWIAFVIYRKTINDISIVNNFGILIRNYDYFTSLILFPFYCLFVHSITGIYTNILQKTFVNFIISTVVSSLIIASSVFFVLKLGDVIVSFKYFYYSLFALFILNFCFTFLFRKIIYSQIQKNYKTKKWTINTIIVGTGKNAVKMAAELEKRSQKNTLIGFISIDQHYDVPKDLILGKFNQLDTIFASNSIEEAIIALDDADEQKLFTYINSLYKYNIEIKFTPRLYEILTGSAKISSFGINPLVSLTSNSMSDWQVAIKRAIDIVVSIMALILLSPLFLYFMVLIKYDSKGPVFYRQKRIGYMGKAFNILKFRTMNADAENGVPKLSSAADERITRVGRILRKYRIDEFPQFWNILKGEMSIVGPRPERLFYINQIIEQAPYYCLLYKIRPGLTSWGPIKIGYSDTIEKMIERLNYDIIYLENMSLFNDLKILILTFEIIFKGKGV